MIICRCIFSLFLMNCGRKESNRDLKGGAVSSLGFIFAAYISDWVLKKLTTDTKRSRQNLLPREMALLWKGAAITLVQLVTTENTIPGCTSLSKG